MTQPRRRIRYDPANDLYAVLGVPPSATLDAVRRSFRQRAKEVHPDLHPDKPDWAHEQFQRLNEAYDVLSDAAVRAEYDERRRRYHHGRGSDGMAWWERPHPQGKPASPPPDPDPRPDPPPHTAPGMPPRRRPTAPYNLYRNARRNRFRFYQFLFIVSSVLFCSSFLAFMTPQATEVPASVPSVTVEPSQTSTPALLPCTDPQVTITYPAAGSEVAEDFAILGRAYHWQFLYYTVEIGPVPWEDVDNGGTPPLSYKGVSMVFGDVLFPGSARVTPGEKVARLTVYLDNGAVLPPCEVRFRVTAKPVETPRGTAYNENGNANHGTR